MPIVSIVPYDSFVYVDGVGRRVDCSDVVDSEAAVLSVHAVHWNGSVGWIEYVNDPFDTVNHVYNRQITDFSQFQKFVDAWTAAGAANAGT